MKTHQATVHLKLVLLALVLTSAALAAGEDKEVPCSLTGLNGNCRLIVDRTNPITPPTIYVRHGSKVKVVVKHTLPFETLSMDLKSTSTTPSADQLANGFSALTQVLGGIQIIQPPTFKANNLKEFATPVNDYNHLCPTEIRQRSGVDTTACQNAIAAALKPFVDELKALQDWSPKALCMVHQLFQPIKSPLAQGNRAAAPCDGSGGIAVPMKDTEFAEWKNHFNENYSEPDAIPDELTKRLAILDKCIAASKGDPLSSVDYQIVTDNQDKLHSAVNSYGPLVQKMSTLNKIVNAIVPPDKTQSFTITEKDAKDNNNVIPVWDLNASNKLSEVAAEVKADKFPDPLAQQFNTLTDAPPKQMVVEFTIQFMNAPWFQISSGIVVPIKPYHSYSVQMPLSAATGSGTCPADPTACGVVAYTPTTNFVPAAMANIPVRHEYVRPGLRFALLATGVVGYSTASTSAVLGGGPSISFGSFVLNAPIVWDRTQKLTGGYTVGGSAGTASAPTIKNVWAWSPSLGISIRVPLGGSSH